MPLLPGARVGPYEILEQIGAGGMGQVVKARDTRLHRLVAIKQSATEFGDRFEREARAVAALNHPNICQLYDIGPDHLVMEYVEGHPLAPVDGMRKLLDLAVQIADGMAAAHAAGIVHRDLKPDNILVTADGRVKILDFGIAKHLGPHTGDEQTQATLTSAGGAIGTVAYMSPEQARGEAAIRPQSDQFSFGLILYELVTGQKAFARGSGAETMTAIIREDAPSLPATVPTPLRWIIERLLAKDSAERYDSSRDLYRELKQFREHLSDTTTMVSGVTAATTAVPVRASRAGWRVPILAAVGLAAVASALTWALTHRGEGGALDLSEYRFTPISQEAATEREPAWSPDGRSIAYTASVDGIMQVVVRQIGATSAVQLTRVASNARLPFWAPDGSRVYFLGGPGSSLWSVSAVGGEPELAIEGATSAALHPRDGRFVFTRGDRLWTLDPSSGPGAREPQPFGQAPFKGGGEVRRFSPDGKTLPIVQNRVLWLLTYPGGAARQMNVGEHAAVGWMPDSRHFVTDWSHDLRMVDTETLTARMILSGPAPTLTPSVSPDGTRMAFVSGDVHWTLAEITLGDGRVRRLGTGSRLTHNPSVGPDGRRLVYLDTSHIRATKAYLRELTLAPTGEVVGNTITEAGDQGAVSQVRLSPDGTRVLFVVAIPRMRSLVVPVAGGAVLPVDPVADASNDAVWSPDGTHIVYQRQVGDERQVAAVRVGTSAAPVVLKRWSVQDAADRSRTPFAWSPDGRWILTGSGPNLHLMAADGSTERQVSSAFPAALNRRTGAIFSRDGREVLMLRREASAPGRPWKLIAIDVASGKERVVTTVDFPRTADSIAGLSLSPDGTKLYTSFSDWPYDIWMLEGFR